MNDYNERAGALVAEAAGLAGLTVLCPVTAADLRGAGPKGEDWAGAARFEGGAWRIEIDHRTFDDYSDEDALRVALHELAHVAAGTTAHSLGFAVVSLELQDLAGFEPLTNWTEYDTSESSAEPADALARWAIERGQHEPAGLAKIAHSIDSAQGQCSAVPLGLAIFACGGAICAALVWLLVSLI